MKRFGGASGAGVKLAAGIPLILLALAAWIVLIAGVSVVRHEAGSDAIYGGLGFTWFVISANFFVLALALVHLFGLRLAVIGNLHAGIIGLLAVVTVLDIFQTQTWNDARKSTPYSTKLGKGAVTAFAGFITLAILNSLLILVIGNAPTVAGRDADVYQTTQVHHNPVAPATATETAHPTV